MSKSTAIKGNVVSARIITDHFIFEGEQVARGSAKDLETLEGRVYDTGMIEGIEEDIRIAAILNHAQFHYERGNYEIAAKYIAWAIKRVPGIMPTVSCYINICERISGLKENRDWELDSKCIEALNGEIDITARYKQGYKESTGLGKWWWGLKTRLRYPKPTSIRCKWCGKPTPHIHPNEPTYGTCSLANSCANCGRMYASSSWIWDSVEGRAYSYYRGSFIDREYYEEFEKEFSPSPTVKR